MAGTGRVYFCAFVRGLKPRRKQSLNDTDTKLCSKPISEMKILQVATKAALLWFFAILLPILY
jgi:hypothetical protein